MIGASIFRPEAVEHRRQAWLGSIQLVRPLSLSLWGLPSLRERLPPLA